MDSEPLISSEQREQILVPEAKAARKRMALRTKIIFYLAAWLIVLMPFLFWRSTWFGRPLGDKKIAEYLHSEDKPRRIQHALVQIGEGMARGDKRAARWYPELVRLARHPVEEIRNTDAWVMGQDTSRGEFHQALLAMLNDPAASVRFNAALALVRFGDASGRSQIVSMLQPARITAPTAGRVVAMAKPGEAASHGALLAKIENAGKTSEVRAPTGGRIRSLSARAESKVAAGDELMVFDPGTEQVWEALRALYLIGRAEDLPAIVPYKVESPNRPQRVRQQAVETERAILARAAR